MGQYISHETNDKELSHSIDTRFSYAVGSMQGYRLTQEDSHLVHFYQSVEFQGIDNNLITMDIKVFAVFDGHGGGETSKFLGENLSGYVMDEIIKRESIEFLQKFPNNKALIIHKLQMSFIATDRNLYTYLHSKHGGKKNTSGSTAIMAVIINNEDLYTVNAGDSRLILSHNGTAKCLSFDHKPNHIGELIRINDANGSVTYNRVGGVLALSRAFGDFNFKLRQIYNPKILLNNNNNNTSENEIKCPNRTQNIITLGSESTQVTCFPEVTLYKLSSDIEFIILACDGIYDVFKNQDLVTFIRKEIAKGKDLEACIETVMEECLERSDELTGRGYDNMTMILISPQLGKIVRQHSSRSLRTTSNDNVMDGLSDKMSTLSFTSTRSPLPIPAVKEERQYDEIETYQEWKERIREKVKGELDII